MAECPDDLLKDELRRSGKYNPSRLDQQLGGHRSFEDFPVCEAPYKIECTYCGHRSRSEVKRLSHLFFCPMYPMLCPNHCSTSVILKKNMEAHFERNCHGPKVTAELVESKLERLAREGPRYTEKNVLDRLECITDLYLKFKDKIAKKERYITHLKEQLKRAKEEDISRRTKDKEKPDVCAKSSKKRCSALPKPSPFRKAGHVRIVEVVEASVKCPPVDIILPDIQSKKPGEKWCSAPFYSHPGGYKMCLTIYPRGVGAGEGTHVSVFANLMKGDFDDQLKWPFIGNVLVKLGCTICVKFLRFTRKSSQWATCRVTKGKMHRAGEGIETFKELKDIKHQTSLHFKVERVYVYTNN